MHQLINESPGRLCPRVHCSLTFDLRTKCFINSRRPFKEQVNRLGFSHKIASGRARQFVQIKQVPSTLIPS